MRFDYLILFKKLKLLFLLFCNACFHTLIIWLKIIIFPARINTNLMRYRLHVFCFSGTTTRAVYSTKLMDSVLFISLPISRSHVTTKSRDVAASAPTAWDFSQDLGNLGIDLGFGDFAMQSWDFYCHEKRNNLSEISTC